jgi:anti-anti-sigma factor
MEITKTTENGKITLSVSGKMNMATAPEFAAAMDEAIAEATASGSIHITVDLKDMDYMASTGLRSFVNAEKKISAAGGTLILLNMQETVKEVFVLTGLDEIFGL